MNCLESDLDDVQRLTEKPRQGAANRSSDSVMRVWFQGVVHDVRFVLHHARKMGTIILLDKILSNIKMLLNLLGKFIEYRYSCN